jgi:asparagine synthase (glutamine-hydrolysing)
MCGIAGIVSFSGPDHPILARIEEATKCIALRGPDGQGIFRDRNVTLGHRRLAVIDTSTSANQPMQDASGRYTIIFNGEFFNFKQHRALLENKGVTLRTESDTEVLLYLYMLEGTECLKKVNGFFSLAIYDKEEQTIFLARDRMGIKPLLYYMDDEKFLFASEMKALMAMGIPKEIDYASLLQYFQFYYIPAPHCIFKNVRKFLPGTFALLKCTDKNSFKTEKYYSIPKPQGGNYSVKLYVDAQKELFELMELSVQRRLVSDVPLGTFLSGGIDSSVVTALAALHKPNIKTFSIGFKDNSFYDETRFAEAVARKCKTDHSVFSLSKDDLFANLHSVLEYMDEPFADSSALPVHILSMHTRKHVTVALSGDGADELFGGYNKHFAELLTQRFSYLIPLLKLSLPLVQKLPLSRSNKYANKIRQGERFLKGASLPMDERYWFWASFNEPRDILPWIRKEKYHNDAEVEKRKKEILDGFNFTDGINDTFYADTQMVLPNDMLTKVDLMSMANSLEVRVPFLDYEVVNFAFSLPESFKIDMSRGKKIVRDAFRKLLPDEVYSRGKKGFEVPLLDWFRGELKTMITTDLLSDEMLERQDIFEKQAVKNIIQRLYSSNPGDTPLQVWSLIVFQYWWKKYL